MTRARPLRQSYDDIPLPALLRSAQDTYVAAVHSALSRAGFDDLPRTGAFIVSAMNWSEASLEAVIGWMGVSKQAVSQSVDALVQRGYLARFPDAQDRRKVHLRLTGRGRGAGNAARSAVEKIDKELRSRADSRRIGQTREVLASLIEIGRSARSRASRARVRL